MYSSRARRHIPDLLYIQEMTSDPNFFARNVALLDNATALNQELWNRVKNDLDPRFHMWQQQIANVRRVVDGSLSDV